MLHGHLRRFTVRAVSRDRQSKCWWARQGEVLLNLGKTRKGNRVTGLEPQHGSPWPVYYSTWLRQATPATVWPSGGQNLDIEVSGPLPATSNDPALHVTLQLHSITLWYQTPTSTTGHSHRTSENVHRERRSAHGWRFAVCPTEAWHQRYLYRSGPFHWHEESLGASYRNQASRNCSL